MFTMFTVNMLKQSIGKHLFIFSFFSSLLGIKRRNREQGEKTGK